MKGRAVLQELTAMPIEQEVSVVPANDQRMTCQHGRLLEGIPDAHGNPTDLMKCCECGMVVLRYTYFPRSYRFAVP